MTYSQNKAGAESAQKSIEDCIDEAALATEELLVAGMPSSSQEVCLTSYLQSQINYNFKNKSLLDLALLHKSMSHYSSSQNKGPYSLANNERLEFLGDAVLDLVMSDILIHQFPDDTEGDLTKKRAALVNEMSLNEIALELKLDTCIQLGKAEMDSGMNKNSRLLSSCLEALFGAIYLDGGFEASKIIIMSLFSSKLEDVRNGRPLFDDYKTQLQEMLQKKYHITPEYVLVSTEGPEHQKIFEIKVQIKGKTVASATGRSKKIAEQNAAKKALEVSHEI